MIKGLPGDDAVLCTASRTYALRGVVLSNSVLVLSPPCRADADALPAASGSSAGTERLLIRDTLHEILEVAPCLPRVHTLGARLRGAEYCEDEDEDLYGDEDAPAPTKKVDAFLSLISHDWRVAQGAKPFTYADALHTIQASPAELDAALAAQHILNLNGTLRPLAPAYLARILQLALALLVAAGWTPGGAGAPAGELARTLEAEHGVRREVATQVMAWFGDVEGDVWSVDVDAVVREVGLGVLRTYQVRPSGCYTGRVG
jgi:sister chromatid cohesion protein DCC1